MGNLDMLDDEEIGRTDALEEAFDNCSMGPDGFCGAAGSEYCEFECPLRRR